MCTAITLTTGSLYFGRTLDLEHGYGEEVAITPRRFPLPFRRAGTLSRHLAIIGMAYVAEGYPLYYDAANEAGLCMAGLRFPEFAFLPPSAEPHDSIAQFELIPWILAQCETVAQARVLLSRLHLSSQPFSPTLPPSPLHWLLADRSEALVLEQTAQGLRLYPNPVGVLTNSPAFPQQLFRLNDFLSLSPEEPENRFASGLPLQAYSRGMGALGLPGDLSSSSRFVRAAFTRLNTLCRPDEEDSVGQFFHILETVSQTRGCCRLKNGACEITRYTSCCSAARGIYYYTTYGNRQPTAVRLLPHQLEDTALRRFPLTGKQQIAFAN